LTSGCRPREPLPEGTADLLASLERDGLEFRLLLPDEISDEIAREMIAVFRAGFGQWPFNAVPTSDLDYLRWKMSGPASIYGSYQGRLRGRLAYSTIVFASWVRVGGARLFRQSFLDACVDPSMRGRGIFSRAVAYQECLEYRCDFSMHERSSRAEVRGRLARRDQRPFGNGIRVLSRVLAPGAAARLQGGRWMTARAGAYGAWVLGSAIATLRGRPRLEVRAASFDARYDGLFEAAAAAFDFIAERGAEFLRWRYDDPRGGRSVAREVVDRGALVGYAVVRTAGGRAYLADLLALPDRRDVVEALVRDAVEVGRSSGAAVIDCWLPRRHLYRAALQRGGFIDRGDAGVSYHPVQASDQQLAPIAGPRARLHYTLGDTDLV
jgi:hypothetical protein